jgi:hypothetical protein
VVNGDSTLALLRKTAVPGEFLVFPDMLMEGPLIRSKGELDWTARAGFLAKEYGVPRKAVVERIRNFNRALNLVSKGSGEVTLWFEEDAFCQINLLFLLANLPAGLRKAGRLSLICPGRPLGLHSPRELEKLFDHRKPVSKERIALSRKAWMAISSPSSHARLQGMLEDKDTFAAWPLLRKGLKAWSSARQGGLEKALLAVVREVAKPLPFPEVFRKVAARPGIEPLGLGDAQVARLALELAARPEPKLRITGRTAATSGPLACGKWKLASTR